MGPACAGAGPRWTAALLAAGALLAGCSGQPEPAGSAQEPVPSASSEPPASATPSPASTLSPAEQEAFEEATAVVLAYRQTIADLYSGARTDLNDLDRVATGELLDANLQGVQQGLAEGYRAEPSGVALEIDSAQPVSVDLRGDAPTVVVQACVDASAGWQVTPDGTRSRGLRDVQEYRVVQTEYLPRPGWAVVSATGAANPEDRRC